MIKIHHCQIGIAAMRICFFFNDTATTEIYTLSLHDALPICKSVTDRTLLPAFPFDQNCPRLTRSEEHTSELQSHVNLVCRLLLEKKTHRHSHRKRGESGMRRPVCSQPAAHL